MINYFLPIFLVVVRLFVNCDGDFLRVLLLYPPPLFFFFVAAVFADDSCSR